MAPLMPRARSRSEEVSRSAPAATSARGSVGSARVWDAATRERRGKDAPPCAASEPPRAIAALPNARLENPAPSGGALPGSVLAQIEIQALITGIVEVTLATELADLDPTRRAELGAGLRRRLFAVFGVEASVFANESLAALAEPEPEQAAEPGPAPELFAAQALVMPLEPDPELECELARLLEQRLGHLGGPLQARADLRRLLVRLALRSRALAAHDASASEEELRRLDVLQRRALKLERSLHEARSALSYVAGLAHVDTGLASIYREVQGLADDSPDRDRKRSMLETIFQANLDLQKSRAG